MPEFKKFFGFFLFAALMLVKISALHVYTHDDTDVDAVENCTICDIALENQNSDFQLDNDTLKISAQEISQEAIGISADQQLKPIRFNFLLFSRPPPFSVS
ncbi:hypothetical protein [Flagellimonas pacifica]|uniref:Uncharacterized protein n=1 Tax=Flagellimonas pacifica TaxID=1247520 RepID=A0A285MRK7_9FLAO|nr:hypothetical protein [Allomuricauda parva]SNY99819.1 hypothetical protein SAMN06265377_1633 [Allomuricauda parva]